MAMSKASISVNARAAKLCTRLIDDADLLRVRVHTMSNGTTLIDAGVDCLGSLEAGVRVAAICMADLGRVQLTSSSEFSQWPWSIHVATSQPVLACLASQYAGWSVSAELDNAKTYRAMASGPGRALSVKESLFDELHYKDTHNQAVLVLENDALPPVALAEKIASDCGVDQSNLTLIVTPTGSMAGSTQVAARVVEVALHKAHETGFALDRILDAQGVTPLPPPVGNGLTAMGRTNDTILFGGRVQMLVSGDDVTAQALAEALPSCTSSDYGKPFKEVFTEYDYDFFKIDGKLFSPAAVWITAVESGNTFYAGKRSAELIHRSFEID